MAGNGPTPYRVLIVDDSPDVRLLLQRTVEALGHQVVPAQSGEEALRLAQENPPDAALLDIRLPGVNGIDVCRTLRANPRTAAIPILLVTSEIDLPTRLAAFQAGADDYLCKPFEPREVAARLQSRLELISSRRQLAQFEGFRATVRLISHEFNNPLQAIVGGLHMLKMADSDAGIDQQEAMAMVDSAAQKLAALARRLVTISEPTFKESPIGEMVDMDGSN